jgi:hypothetical protein
MAHWISKDWKLKNILIDFYQLSGSHSGENLAEAFENCCLKYGILSKVYIIF